MKTQLTVAHLIKPLACSIALVSALSAPVVSAYDAGDFVVRGGATLIDPEASSSVVESDGVDVLGARVSVENNTQLGLTLAYMYTNRLGVELLAATPFKHDVVGRGALPGVAVAEVEHLPPTLSVIYYLTEGSAFQPYVGAGVNYTLFFSEESRIGGSAELENSFGLSFQVGADYQLNDNWHLNASVRWIDIDTDATLRNTALGRVEASVDIDPFVYSVMLGYHF